jgi:Domain of unknown function (DUF6438)
MRPPALLLLALAAAALIPQAATAADATFKATLTRGACFGTCPVYTVSIDAGGKVTFEGGPSTRRGGHQPCVGPQTWRIPLSSVAALRARIDRADFFSLQDRYQGPVRDLPVHAVTVTRNGRTKTVAELAGDMVGMPKAVIEIETAIDKASGDARCLTLR